VILLVQWRKRLLLAKPGYHILFSSFSVPPTIPVNECEFVPHMGTLALNHSLRYHVTGQMRIHANGIEFVCFSSEVGTETESWVADPERQRLLLSLTHKRVNRVFRPRVPETCASLHNTASTECSKAIPHHTSVATFLSSVSNLRIARHRRTIQRGPSKSNLIYQY
jgi:hypothetical protein